VLPRALLLDLDDTILDDSGSIHAAWTASCEDAARDVAGLDPAALHAQIDRVRRWFWSDPERHRVGRLDMRAASTRIVDDALRAMGHDRPDVAARIGNAYRDRREAAIRPLPGAIEALEASASRTSASTRRYGVWVDAHGRGLPPDPPARPDRIVRSLAELAD
jgi:putative hydrolase of the HAD superfamily